VASGSLVIVGGGRLPDEIYARFVQLAGGTAARIVVVPTAGEQERYADHPEVRRLSAAGASAVVLLHTRDRDRANEIEFLEPLKSATGVWFCGGRQWRLVDAYEETLFLEECRQVLQRGGVIGGSSAGATIQGEFLVRGHPLGNEVMMAEGYEQGFGFLPGSAIDQHFTQRSREADLESVHRTHPQLVCLGIDEGTAAVVTGSQLEVIGGGSVSVYPARRPETASPPPRTILEAGERYDFAAAARQVE
jgi:cyanophycinase